MVRRLLRFIGLLRLIGLLSLIRLLGLLEQSSYSANLRYFDTVTKFIKAELLQHCSQASGKWPDSSFQLIDLLVLEVLGSLAVLQLQGL